MKRYDVLHSSMGGVDEVESESGEYVRADDALAREAALREELAERKRKQLRSCQIAIGKSQLAKELQAKLTAAEQRDAGLVELLQQMIEADSLIEQWTSNESAEGAEIMFQVAFDKIKAALKPTESGASE